jgi:hypothetical protein
LIYSLHKQFTHAEKNGKPHQSFDQKEKKANDSKSFKPYFKLAHGLDFGLVLFERHAFGLTVNTVKSDVPRWRG